MRALCLPLVLMLLGPPLLPRGAEAAEARPGRPSAAALEAARRYLCPNGGTPRRGGRCSPAPAGGGALWSGGADPEVRDWDRGIAPASRAQRPCPAGTTPAAVRENPGITRCLPV